MDNLRHVEFKENQKTCEGLFHQWYTEVIGDNTNFTGVVEDSKGNIKFINADDIRFTDGLLHGFSASIHYTELRTTEIGNLIMLFTSYSKASSKRAFIFYYSNVSMRDKVINVLKDIDDSLAIEYFVGDTRGQLDLMKKIEDGLTSNLILAVSRDEEVTGVLANRCVSLNSPSVPNPLLIFSDITNKPILFRYTTEEE